MQREDASPLDTNVMPRRSDRKRQKTAKAMALQASLFGTIVQNPLATSSVEAASATTVHAVRETPVAVEATAALLSLTPPALSVRSGPSGWLLDLLDNASTNAPQGAAAATRENVGVGVDGLLRGIAMGGDRSRARVDALLEGAPQVVDHSRARVDALLRSENDVDSMAERQQAHTLFEHQRLRAATRESEREAAAQAAEFFQPEADGLPWGTSFTFRALPEDVPPPNRDFDDDVRDAREFRRVSASPRRGHSMLCTLAKCALLGI